MRRSPAALAVSALCAAWLAAAGCSHEVEGRLEDRSAGAGPPAYGDTFVHAFISDIAGLIPNITSDAASHEVGDRIYDGLVSNDKDLNWTGQLAESWDFSPDCLTLTFHLRRNVRWHDGHPFTADDVKFTYEAMINPKTPTGYRDDFLQVKSLEVLDPYTVRITYPRPHARALQTWGMNMLPKHLLEETVAAGKLKEAKQNSRPVGTGAYRFGEWKSGEKVVLVANPDYYAGRPYIGRLVYRIIPSQGTIFLELKAKGVDATSLTALQYSRQTNYRAFERSFTKFRHPGNGYTYLGFNLKDPRFADRRVRHAFAHAINKRELIDGVRVGLAREATGPYKPGTWVYTDKVAKYPYDMDKARRLLAEAGWKERNSDGLLVKDGKPFTFELLTNQGNDERKKVAEIVQAQLRELGVGVEIRILEWAAFLKEHIKKRNFEAIVMGWGIGIDPDQYVVWHSSQSGTDQLNHISYANPEVDQMLEAGRTTCVREERVKYYHRLQELLADDLPLVFLYFSDALPVVSSRVHGIDPGPNGIRYRSNMWFVPKPLQRYTAG